MKMLSLYTRQSLWLLVVLACLSMLSGCNCGVIVDPPFPNGVLKTDLTVDILAFGPTTPEPTQSKSFLLYYEGNQAPNITDITIVDDNKKAFSVELPTLPFQPGQGKNAGTIITVTYTRTSTEAASAKLRFSSQDADNVDQNGHFFVKLTAAASASPPSFSWNCGSNLDFGFVDIGKPVQKECILLNKGATSVTFTSATYQKKAGSEQNTFKLVSPSFPATIKGDGGTLTFTVAYDPKEADANTDTGLFTLVSDFALTNPPILRTVGQTSAPQIELLPVYPACQTDKDCEAFHPTLTCQSIKKRTGLWCKAAKPIISFPLAGRGDLRTRTFLIRNIGTSNLKVENVQLTSPSSKDFRIVSQGLSLPLTLESGNEKEITVEYQPSDKEPDNGSIVVASNAKDQPKATIDLFTQERGCLLNASPRDITFVGPISEEITLVNRGNELCILKKVSFLSGKSAPFSVLPVPAPGTQIAPGGELKFLIKFAPTDTNNHTDTLLIELDEPGAPTTSVKVSGRVTAGCKLKFSPGNQLTLGFQSSGYLSSGTLTLLNDGNFDCELSGFSIKDTTPAGHGSFAIASPPTLPLKLTPGDKLRLTITYQSKTTTNVTSTLTIKNNDTKQPTLSATLVGVAKELCLRFTPSSVNLGNHKYGCASELQTIHIIHTGAPGCPKSITIWGGSITNDKDGVFRINSFPTTPRTLQATQSISVKVSYKPKKLGISVANLSIVSDAPGQSPSNIPLRGEGLASNNAKDVYKQPTQPKMDILFVIDSSASMVTEQNRLGGNAQAFLDGLKRRNIDYQVMVTTMDVTTTPAKAGCGVGTIPIVTPNTSNPAQEFASNARVGANGSASEQGLEAMYKALSSYAAASCNKGFHRQDASLSIVLLSDEKDSSPAHESAYIQFLRHLKGPRSEYPVRATVITGPPPTGCTSTQTGQVQAAPRYWNTAKETNGGQISICDSSWFTKMSTELQSAAYLRQFPLRRPPLIASIQVKVNAQVVKQDPLNGWAYDSNTNHIIFGQNAIPSPGTTIEITYQVNCLP